MESLIKAGALDRFGERAAILDKLDEIAAAQHKDQHNADQSALFAVVPTAPKITLSDKVTPLKDKLTWEKELLGIYVSGHPTDQFKETFDKYRGSVRAAVSEMRPNFPMTIGGVVEVAKVILTKKGERMAFITIADKDASIEAVAFPTVFKENQEALKEGTVLLVKGKVSRRNGEPSILIDKVKVFA